MNKKRFLLMLVLLVAVICLLAGWSARGLLRDAWRLVFTPQLPDAPAPTAQALTESVQINLERGTLTLPRGFQIEIYAEGLNNPRMMAIGPDDQLYVAERGAGRVLRLPDRDGDGRADGLEVAAEGISQPSSLDFFTDGSLYVAETEKIWRFSQPDIQGIFQQRDLILDGLPAGGNHHTRTIRFSPDGRTLFVSIGSSCNVCEEEDPRRATVMAYDLDPQGSTLGEGRIYGNGLRNAVGIVFRPGTDELWATNNGRDLIGDDLPPETVYLVQEDGDHGWPHCHSGRIVDPDFGWPDACQGVVAPAVEIQAHSAPLGLGFYSGNGFPPQFQGDLFVALHGSWNRSEPTGYKIIRIPIDEYGQPGRVQDFATGWLTADGTWGRPVDVISAPDGGLYTSDDREGIIYRIFYTP